MPSDLSWIISDALVLMAAGPPELLNIVMAVWLFSVGACIGSFMNVVIYRVPEGLSVVHPGSRCPKCLTPIRGYDNIPIISWLVLRAKCRDCGVGISARYPSIEALVAIVFLIVALVEPLASGTNLPQTRFDFSVDSLNWIWILYACQMLLLSTLICATMIVYDGHTIPLKVLLPALIVGLATPQIVPAVQPTAGWQELTGFGRPLSVPIGTVTLIVAMCLGQLVVRAFHAALVSRDYAAMLLTVITSATVMGGEATLAVTAFAAIAYSLGLLLSRGLPWLASAPLHGYFTLGVLVHIILWRPIQAGADAISGNRLALPTIETAVAILFVLAGAYLRPAAKDERS